MPGEKPLPIDVTPDFLQTVTLKLNSVLGTNQVLYFCARDTFIDKATLVVTTGDDNDTYQLRPCTSGTAPGSEGLSPDVGTGVTAD